MSPEASRARRGSWAAVAGLLLVPAMAFMAYAVWGSRSASPIAEGAPSSPPESSEAEPQTGQKGEGETSDDPVVIAQRLERSDPKQARRLLREELARHPENVRALEELSQKVLNDENHKEARRIALACLDRDPKNKRCDDVRRHALEPRDSAATMASLDLCLTENPSSTRCLGAKVVELIRAGDVEGAARTAAVLEGKDKSGLFFLLSDGRVRSARGDYAGARQSFDKACALSDDYACFRVRALREEGW